jgi:hypothetical protein
VIVAMIVNVTMLMRPGVRWRVGDGTMTHAAFGDDVIRECLELRASALEHHYFEATVEMKLERPMLDAMMVMKLLG